MVSQSHVASLLLANNVTMTEEEEENEAEDSMCPPGEDIYFFCIIFHEITNLNWRYCVGYESVKSLFHSMDIFSHFNY